MNAKVWFLVAMGLALWILVWIVNVRHEAPGWIVPWKVSEAFSQEAEDASWAE